MSEASVLGIMHLTAKDGGNADFAGAKICRKRTLIPSQLESQSVQ